MQLPLADTTFNLDVSGIAGFFGGEEAIAAMTSVHIYKGRKWLGWYNSPGSYTIARKYGQLAKSRLWDGLYPGVNVDPAVMLELDSQKGPKFRGIASGTIMKQSGHLGYLFAKYCREYPSSIEVQGRTTSRAGVTIAKLRKPPKGKVNPTLPSTYATLTAFIAIGGNIATCVIAALFGEWFSLSMILLGILCNGFSCYVIGSGALLFKHPVPADNSPEGDGFMIDDDQAIVLKGPEGAVNSITRGQFLLHYHSETEYHDIGVSSVALTLQFLLQLFIIPQAHLFGQILFLVSLAISYAYNAYLASIDKESLQQNILLKVLDPDGPLEIQKYILPNRTSMSVFVLLAVIPPEILSNPSERDGKLRGVLDAFVPNKTAVWENWKSIIVRDVHSLCATGELSQKLPTEVDDTIFSEKGIDTIGLNDKNLRLLSTLLADARDGLRGYLARPHRVVEMQYPTVDPLNFERE